MKTAIAVELMPAVKLYLRTCQFVLLFGVWIFLLICDGYAAAAGNPAKYELRQISETDSNGPTMIMSHSKEKFVPLPNGMIAVHTEKLKRACVHFPESYEY